MPRRRRIEQGDAQTAVAYIRVSTAEQANGLEAQQAAITAWAAANGVTVAAWAIDRGVSGSTSPGDRDGFLKALDALGEHRAGVLVAANRTRLARDVAAAAAVERLVRESGARVVTADGVDASDTPEGALIRAVLDAFAAYELALIRVRTRKGLAAKRRRGEKLGGVTPFGWRSAEGVGGVKVLRRDEPEQSALRMMRKLREDGHTFAEIAAALDAGAWPCRGKRWHASSVLRALRAADVTATAA